MKRLRELRPGGPDDYQELAEVMYDAIRNGPSRYSQEQRAAWAPEVPGGNEWTARLSTQSIVLAETDQQIAGFMTLAADGYIDLAYIRPSAQRTGLFRQLYQDIEQIARRQGMPRLWVHASLMAQPAFAKVGFEIIGGETVEVRGLSFARFEMEKRLDASSTGEKL